MSIQIVLTQSTAFALILGQLAERIAMIFVAWSLILCCFSCESYSLSLSGTVLFN